LNYKESANAMRLDLGTVGANMLRTMIITITVLLATIPLARSEDADVSLPNLALENQSLHRIDTNTTPRKYDKICKENQRLVLKSLRSYSESALESLGMPQQGMGLVSATLGLVFNEARLNLNKSKTLSLEIKDVTDSNPTVYFGVNLDW
jgi:hypothetical protein